MSSSTAVPPGPGAEPAQTKETPPPTPVRFPEYAPQLREGPTEYRDVELVNFLRDIQRPTDVKIEHLEATGLRVLSNAAIEDVVCDAAYLPRDEWTKAPITDFEDNTTSISHVLNNGRNAPGAKTFIERMTELSIPNDAAFRTVRRQPVPPGENAARLGNAYEFFRNLEMTSVYWDDTSCQGNRPSGSEHLKFNAPADVEPSLPTLAQPKTNYGRTNCGSQMPADVRNGLLSSFLKLLSYDFGCNVGLSRVEPRLLLTSKSTQSSSARRTSSSRRTSSFPSNVYFCYRTPTDRASARLGLVEGPVAVLSARSATGFEDPREELLDLCRETVAVLIGAQHRARENETENKVGDGQWWATARRWGGGSGGPIGREGERLERLEKETGAAQAAAAVEGSGSPDAKKQKGVSKTLRTSPNTTKKSAGTTLPMYDAYRMIRPPSSTWDRKTRYMSIGRVPNARYDDVFLLSSLNHHICVVRARIPDSLMDTFAGTQQKRHSGDELRLWRSRWYDMFIVEDRVEALKCVWGMLAYTMRRMD